MRTPNHRKSYIAHHVRAEQYVALINQIYEKYNKEAAKIVLNMTDYDGSEPFNWSDFPETNYLIKKLQKEFAQSQKSAIINATTTEWNIANRFNDSLVNTVLKHYGADPEKHKKYFWHNEEALKAFQNRKINGLNLSQKIWNQSKDYLDELEAALSVGMEKGTSAVTLSKRISKYLKDFDTLKKDYGEKYGKATHILDCEYRSARLARTETNMAYRTADNARWQQLDFVVGYEIKRSGTKYECPVCESLTGKYPKDFLFTGWHPNCRCYMVSILNTEEEFWNDAETSVNEVKDVPENFKKWVADNADRIEKAEQRGTLPYFLRDNKEYYSSFVKNPKESGYFTTFVSSDVKIFTPTERLDLSGVGNALSEIAKQHPEYFNKGYGGIFHAPESQKYFMSADIKKGKIFVNFGYDDNNFNAGNSLVRAVDKLQKGIKLDRYEEYSIEVLWHEILHLKSKNTTILPEAIAPHFGFQRTAVETINQLVARKTYPKLLEQFGGKARHQDWVINNGYGYSETVKNTQKLLKVLNIDNDKFYREAEKLLMQDYSDFDKNLVALMERMSGKKNLTRIFGRIEMVDFDNYLKNLE